MLAPELTSRVRGCVDGKWVDSHISLHYSRRHIEQRLSVCRIVNMATNISAATNRVFPSRKLEVSVAATLGLMPSQNTKNVVFCPFKEHEVVCKVVL